MAQNNMDKFEIQNLRDEMGRLRSEFEQVKAAALKNDFSSAKVFSKACIFNDRLKVPHFASAPSVAEVGDIIEVGGKLYICTTAGDVASPATFTLVGSQT